jgi:large subunit ribosomal protein L1
MENINAFLERIIRLKPASSKGTYLRSMAVSTTMGPGVRVDMASVKDMVK